jgi:hypothetical protein
MMPAEPDKAALLIADEIINEMLSEVQAKLDLLHAREEALCELQRRCAVFPSSPARAPRDDR